MTTGRSPGVVCISRATGAGGEAVGRLVAKELGYRYIDEEIVESAAEKLDVEVDLVADVETRRSLTRRLLEEVLVDVAHSSLLMGTLPPRESAKASADYRELIQQVIRETADQGEVVIVAHGASLALAGRPGLLRVLITGSPEVRADRLASEFDLPAAESKKLVREGDRAREDYLKRFYGVERELPTHYDLTVNTDILGTEVAASLLLAACGPAVR